MSYPNPNTTPDDIEIVRATCRDCGTDIYAAPICDHPGEICETCEGIAHSAKLVAEVEGPKGSSMQKLHTLRMLGQNVTMRTYAWMNLLDELRLNSDLARRIREMLAEDGCLPICRQ